MKGKQEDWCKIIEEVDDEEIEQSGYCRVITSTVGQFTGQVDRNEKPIYEGDVIKWHFVNTGEDEPDYTDLVAWDECGFFLNGGAPLTVAIDYCEVIGNIHDNPDLLK